MKKFIYNNLYKVIELLINTNQHGFMNGKSCTTQYVNNVLTVYDETGKLMHEGKQTDMMFLDCPKALDSVDNNMLIYKLHKLGFSG